MARRHKPRLKALLTAAFADMIVHQFFFFMFSFRAASHLKRTNGHSTGVMLRGGGSRVGVRVWGGGVHHQPIRLGCVHMAPGHRPLVAYRLPLTSLIVPWAAPWCQLLPAPCLHKTRGRGCRESKQLEGGGVARRPLY